MNLSSRKPMFTFEALASTGLDKVPLKSLMYVIETNTIYTFKNNTGVTSSTTIQEALDNFNIQLIKNGVDKWNTVEGDYNQNTAPEYQIEIDSDDNEHSLNVKLVLNEGPSGNIRQYTYDFNILVPEHTQSIYTEINMVGYALDTGDSVSKTIKIFADSDENKLKINLMGPTDTSIAVFSVDYLYQKSSILADSNIDYTDMGWSV
jgi:hypothetical protein